MDAIRDLEIISNDLYVIYFSDEKGGSKLEHKNIA